MTARQSRPRASAGAEVVTGSGDHGVDAGAVATFEVTAAHPVFGLDVPNDQLDNGATAHLAAGPDAELLDVVAGAAASSVLR